MPKQELIDDMEAGKICKKCFYILGAMFIDYYEREGHICPNCNAVKSMVSFEEGVELYKKHLDEIFSKMEGVISLGP